MHERISHILGSAGNGSAPIRPTELFNEGWMLRLLLDYLSTNPVDGHPFSFFEGARWFSEALLPSAFLARRRGDELAEGWTNADGVVGHFAISLAAKGDLTLSPQAKQFVVIEAKMYSELSPGVKRCADYDQAARNVACMAEVLSRAQRPPAAVERLAFLVVAPESEISRGIFNKRVEKLGIRAAVEARVRAYAGDRDEWLTSKFAATLDAIEVKLISWEEALQGLPDEFRQFYRSCLKYNRGITRPHQLESDALR
jgi:hypothetical protein